MTDDELTPEQQMTRISRRSFVWAGITVIAAYGGLKWLATRREDAGTPFPFRRAMDFDSDVSLDAYNRMRLAPTYAASTASSEPRLNEYIGVGDYDDDYSITISGVADKTDDVSVKLTEIMALPKQVMTMDLHCIEGWTTRITWGGARLIDLVRKYPPSTSDGSKLRSLEQDLAKLPPYVGMATPSGEYYVSLDTPSALHPQTLLCWEMNGKPLEAEHGAPLRLVIPVKYGIKNIKQIGTITYSDTKPGDYWAEQGYDWYAGL